MRKISSYLSKEFVNHVWPAFSKHLKSNTTKTDYLTCISSICEYLQKDFIEIGFVEAKGYFNMLVTYHEPNKPEITLKTINNRLSIMRSLSAFIIESGLISLPPGYRNIFNSIDIPSYEFKILPSDIPILSDVKQLCHHIQSEKDLSLFLIVSFVLRHGLTANEVCNIKQNQLLLTEKDCLLFLNPETRKQRIITIEDHLFHLLKNYLITYEMDNKEYLFYNRNNNCITKRNVESKLKKHLLEGNIPSFTLQDLRNLSICYMLKTCTSPNNVANYLGVSAAYSWFKRYEDATISLPDIDSNELYEFLQVDTLYFI